MDNVHLFIILDGHGTFGHVVSAYLKKIIPAKLENHLKKDIKKLND